jgi:hypothetical protein
VAGAAYSYLDDNLSLALPQDHLNSKLPFMKKLFITTCALALAATSVFAQKKDVKEKSSETPFHKGSSTIALGIGLGGVSYNYYGSVNRMPAGVLYFDHGIKDNLGPGNLGIGGLVGYTSARYKYSSGGYKATWTNVVVAVRATWHLTILADKNNKFDPYGGAMAGVRVFGYNDSYYEDLGLTNPYSYNSVYPTYGLFVGAKYNFSPNFGAWSELGYDIAFLKLGLNFNF